MPLTNHFRQRVLENVFGVAPYTVPTLYMPLVYGADLSIPPNLTEASYTGYARQQLTGHVDPASGGLASLTDDQTFPSPSSSLTPSFFASGVYDASSGGNLLIWNNNSPVNLFSGRAGSGADYAATTLGGNGTSWLRFNLGGGSGALNQSILDAILDYMLGGANYAPTAIEFGLITAHAGDLSTYTEVGWGGYARNDVTGAWNTYVGGSSILRIRNTNLTTWTAGGVAVVKAALFFDSVLFDAFPTFQTVVGGDIINIQASAYEFFLN